MINSRIKRIKYFAISLMIIFVVGFSAVSLGNLLNRADESIIRKTSIAIQGEPLQKSLSHKRTRDRFDFTLNAGTGEFSLYERNTGKSWLSNPDDFRKDPIAKGMNRTRLGSQIIVLIADAKGNMQEMNSLVSSVSEGGLTVYPLDDGFLCSYTFPREGISICIMYQLTDKGLTVQIPSDDIVENGEFLVVEISLLPFFGAASNKDSGYMLVPDGAGGLINFNNGKSRYAAYEQMLYGQDRMIVSENKTPDNQPILLPVFGMSYQNDERNNSGGFVGIIQDGAALSTIRSSVNGKNSSYNNIYPSFHFRIFNEAKVLSRTWAAKTFYMVSKSPVETTSFIVDYIFMAPENNNYSDMAEIVAGWLIQKGMSDRTLSDTPLFLDVYCGITKQKGFAGIPYNGVVPLTTFDQTEVILSEMTLEAQVPVVLRMMGLNDASLRHGMVDSEILPLKILGGRRGFMDLLEAVMDYDVDLFVDSHLTEFSKSGKGASTFFHSVKSVSNSTVLITDYRMSTGVKNTDVTKKFLVRPSIAASNLQDLLESAKTYSTIGIDISEMAMSPYSGYGRDSIDREQTADLFAETVAGFNDIKFSSSYPSAYMLPYLDKIFSLPMNSSNFDIIDTEIPFIQIVLHGMIEYSTEPINLCGSPEQAFLKAVETGASLCFALTDASYEDVKDTGWNNLFGTAYADWKTYIIEKQKAINEVRTGLQDCRIIEHEIVAEDIVMVEYSNHTRIYINYSDEVYLLNNYSIDGMSYLRVDAEEQVNE